MRRLDEKKRQQIHRAAARLFASRPFHQVRLDDVAAAARVGKGTVYLYFKSKDEMYRSLIQEGFAALVDRLGEQLRGGEAHEPWAALEVVTSELAAYAVDHPDVYEMLRSVPLAKLSTQPRRSLTTLIERIIRRGVRSGAMCDPHPELTATFIPSLVRSAMLFGPKDLTAEVLAGQMMRLLKCGLKKRGNGRCD